MSEIFNGTAGEMRESEWLASEDISGLGDVNVVIESVHKSKNVEFEGGRKKPVVYSIKFVGKSRQLILNATNRKFLVKKYGTNVKGWSEQKVTLYVIDGVKVGKDIKQGIRMK